MRVRRMAGEQLPPLPSYHSILTMMLIIGMLGMRRRAKMGIIVNLWHLPSQVWLTLLNIYCNDSNNFELWFVWRSESAATLTSLKFTVWGEFGELGAAFEPVTGSLKVTARVKEAEGGSLCSTPDWKLPQLWCTLHYCTSVPLLYQCTTFWWTLLYQCTTRNHSGEPPEQLLTRNHPGCLTTDWVQLTASCRKLYF